MWEGFGDDGDDGKEFFFDGGCVKVEGKAGLGIDGE